MTATPIDIRNVTDPNIVEYVKASAIERGDQIIVNTTIFTVTVVTPYVLAYDNGGAVRTSGPDGHWPALHILTNYGGLVRFPHEDMARLGRI